MNRSSEKCKHRTAARRYRLISVPPSQLALKGAPQSPVTLTQLSRVARLPEAAALTARQHDRAVVRQPEGLGELVEVGDRAVDTELPGRVLIFLSLLFGGLGRRDVRPDLTEADEEALLVGVAVDDTATGFGQSQKQ